MFFIVRSKKDGRNLKTNSRKFWRRGETNFLVLTFGCEDDVSDKGYSAFQAQQALRAAREVFYDARGEQREARIAVAAAPGGLAS